MLPCFDWWFTYCSMLPVANFLELAWSREASQEDNVEVNNFLFGNLCHESSRSMPFCSARRTDSCNFIILLMLPSPFLLLAMNVEHFSRTLATLSKDDGNVSNFDKVADDRNTHFWFWILLLVTGLVLNSFACHRSMTVGGRTDLVSIGCGKSRKRAQLRSLASCDRYRQAISSEPKRQASHSWFFLTRESSLFYTTIFRTQDLKPSHINKYKSLKASISVSYIEICRQTRETQRYWNCDFYWFKMSAQLRALTIISNCQPTTNDVLQRKLCPLTFAKATVWLLLFHFGTISTYDANCKNLKKFCFLWTSFQTDVFK